MALTFYLRRKHDPDFTIAVMPDTQNYVVDPWNQQHFDKQTAWIVANRDKDRTHIRDMIGVGLIDATWPARFPEILGERLRQILANPEG